MYIIITLIALFVLLIFLLGNESNQPELQKSISSMNPSFIEIENKYLKELSKTIKLELFAYPNYPLIFRNKSVSGKTEYTPRNPSHNDELMKSVLIFGENNKNNNRSFEQRITEELVREIWDSPEKKATKSKRILQILLPSLEKDLVEAFADAILATDSGRHLDAIEIYNSLILYCKKEIPLAIFYNNRGCLKFHCGLKSDFINDFKKALKHNNKSFYSYNLGCGYTHIDDWEKSITYLKKFNSNQSKEIVTAIESWYYPKEEVKVKNEIISSSESNGNKLLSVNPIKRKINNVYVGLPEHLIHRIVWVKLKYRKNPLSWIPGGTTVVVEFHGQDVFGYDNIKRPSAYVKEIWENEYIISDIEDSTLNEQTKIDFYRQKICRIFAQNNELIGDSFKEVWNHETAIKLPWASLISYDNKTPLVLD